MTSARLKLGPLASCCLLLACLALAARLARADEASDACLDILGKLHVFDGGLYREFPDTFEFEGKFYKGCVVTVVGDSNKTPGKFPPVNRLYPESGSAIAKAGWKADREADGPDGTAFRISRGDIFCLIRGSWDGGVVTDPKGARSPLFLITAQCAKQ
jgi:hypothetical protein